MKDIPRDLALAFDDGRYHDYLAAKIDQLVALHAAAKSVDSTYIGTEMQQHIAMLKACDLSMWQMKEALGYSVPNDVDERYPRQLGGNGGANPFVCGTCTARDKYPDLHLKHDAARHGGMYVAPSDFKKV